MLRPVLVVAVSLTGFISCTDNGALPVGSLPPTEYVAVDDAPSWSPRGDRIAFTHLSAGLIDSAYPTGLYVIDTSGNDRRLVIAGQAYNPDWSPDGRRIAFNNGDIFTIGILGDSLVHVNSGGQSHFPSWSNQGSLIAFDRSGTIDTVGIWVVSIVTQVERRMGIGGNPDWSPDSHFLVHLRGLLGVFGEEVFLMDSSGLDPVRLTFNQVNDRYPKWSPDGTLIT